MGICSFCEESVAMPYTCRLCGHKFCSKHRLPENHSCINLDHYKTRAYQEQKVEKQYELGKAKRGTMTTSSNFRGRGGSDVWTLTWSTGSKHKDILILAAVISIFSIFTLNVLAILTTYIVAVVASYFIYFTRSYAAKKFGGYTSFEIFPLGVALALIPFFWTALFIVKFRDYVNEGRDRAMLSFVTISSLLFVGLIPNILLLFSGGLIQSGFFLILLYAFSFVGSLFGITAIFLFLPFYNFEGQFIFQYDLKLYFLGLISALIIYFGIIGSISPF
ncbi:MAG: hypothetical protein INQ03_02985 [Candidatus Heimdallarchaeota archaeon]|nr:hypothetical protein [Candidatus Heimdallarchaeota archaeon]